MLKPALARGELHCVGATTLDEYKKYFEKDAALTRRFQPVFVNEPSSTDAVAILRGLKEKYEIHHGIRISDEAILSSVQLSDRYITDRFLPDKAIDLMDEAASKVKMEIDSKPEEIDQLDRDLIKLQMEKNVLSKDNEKDEKKNEKIDSQISDIQEKLNILNSTWESEKKILDTKRNLNERIDQAKEDLEGAQRSGDLTKASEIMYGLLPSLQKEYEEIPKKPGFGLAHDKAKEDWRSLQEDKESATSREELNKYISKDVKIPNPETDGDDRPDWSEWYNSKEGKKHDQLIAQQKELSDAAQDYYRTTTKPASDKLFAYQGTLKKEGDKVVGTKEQIAKFRKLAAEYNEASNEYDRLFTLQDEPMNEAGALLSAFIKDYDRRMAIWKPYLKEIDRVYSEISEIFDMFIDEAYEKYLMTTGDENEDGVTEFVNGGDYTDEKGKTYPGYGRFYEDIDARMVENNELADQYWDTYGSYGYKYLAETIDPFLINKQFKGCLLYTSPSPRD